MSAAWTDALHELHARAEDTHWWFVGRRRIIAAVAARILPPAGATIVDVGCGTGATLASLPATHERIGYDPAPRAIELARERFPGVRFEVGIPVGSVSDGRSDPAGEAADENGGSVAHVDDAPLRRADLVLLTDVLEHVEDDAGLLARILDIVPAGCHVLITVPAEPELWSAHDVAVGHLRRYTRESLGELWSGREIGVRLLSAFNARLYRAIRVSRGLGRGRGGTDVEMPPRIVNALLMRVFAGEAEKLVAAMGGARGYRRGVSLIAVLEVMGGSDV